MSEAPSQFITLFKRYLEHSYRYYVMHSPLIEDEEYDSICRRLLANWDKFHHRHKYLVTEDDLKCGTGYAIDWSKCPQIVQSCKRFPDVTLDEGFANWEKR